MKSLSVLLSLLALIPTLSSVAAAADRDTQVRNDRRDVQALQTWIYNDLPKGFAEASRTGKPLLVVLRCVP